MNLVLLCILFSVFLDVLSMSLIIPVLPDLLMSLGHGGLLVGVDLLGLFGSSWALMQFLISPLFGLLADRFGRRTVIVWSNFVLALDYLIMAYAQSVEMLFVGRLLSGLCCGSIVAINAYIIDISSFAKRAKYFGFLGGTFSLAMIAGPGLGGILGSLDLRLPFKLAFGLSLANAFFGFYVLKESLEVKSSEPILFKKMIPFLSFGILKREKNILLLSMIQILGFVCLSLFSTVFIIYLEQILNFDLRQISLILMLNSLILGIVQAGLSGCAIKKFGFKPALIFSLFCGGAGFYILSQAKDFSIVLIGLAVSAFWALAGTLIQTQTSLVVKPQNQGEYQAAISSLRGLSSIVGPLLFSQIFALSLSKNYAFLTAGSPFLLASLLLGISTILAFFYHSIDTL